MSDFKLFKKDPAPGNHLTVYFLYR